MGVGGEHEVEVAVAVEVARIEGHPSAGDALADGGGLEVLGVTRVLEIDESFSGVRGVVGEIRDGGYVQVAIAIEVTDAGAVGAVQGVVPLLGKSALPVCQIEADPMVGLRRAVEFAVVSVADQNIRESIAVEVGRGDMAEPPLGRLLQQGATLESTAAIVAIQEE